MVIDDDDSGGGGGEGNDDDDDDDDDDRNIFIYIAHIPLCSWRFTTMTSNSFLNLQIILRLIKMQ